MAKVDKSKKNVLPNTYIPVLSNKVLSNILSRLPKSSLIELVYVWPKLLHTQPHNSKDDGRRRQRVINQKEINQKVSQYARELKQSGGKVPKKKIIDKILFEYWFKGLNLLQISQVDCQLIVDRPNAYYWVSSTVKDAYNKEVPISLDPQAFLDSLAKDLNKLFLTYIYVCRHPSFPLIIIRVQVFDLQAIKSSINRPHISSHKPYFLAIPLNSPHIIHSSGNDIIKNIIMQVIERCLPQNPQNLLKIVTSEKQRPIRSLESMHILNGSSRFGSSLGIWTPYADGTVDMLPLNAVEKHKCLSNGKEDNDELSKLKKIANLRFKGSVDGQLKSEKLYDDNRTSKKKKKASIYLDSDDDTGDYEEFSEKNEFESITPIQYSEFIIKEKIGDHYSSIAMKFTGSDVFAGLHELSVHNDEILDPSIAPGWLTGEEGASCGVIKDGKFTRNL